MELFEELRREYEFGVGSIAGVARKFGVHRRLECEAVGCARTLLKPAPSRTASAAPSSNLDVNLDVG